MADQGDVAGAAINAYLFNAFARGVPLKGVADHGANLPGASAGGIVVRKDLVDSGAYQGPASLQGWKVGTAAPGSVGDVARDRWLSRAGLGLADVEVVNLSYPDIGVALANKGIDAAYYQEPFTTISVERSLAVRVAPAHEMYPNPQIAIVLFGDRLLKDPALSLRYVRAYTRGVRDYVRAFPTARSGRLRRGRADPHRAHDRRRARPVREGNSLGPARRPAPERAVADRRSRMVRDARPGAAAG